MLKNCFTIFFEDAVMKCDVFEYEFDTKAHMPLLREIAGNRDINSDINFVYDVVNGYVRFESATLYNGEKHYELCLCTEIEDCYLDNKPFKEIDPITQKKLNNPNSQS